VKEQFSIFLRYFFSRARDLASIIAVIAFFQLVVLQQPIPNIGKILIGVLLIMLGLTFFIRGLEMGLFTIGDGMTTISDALSQMKRHRE
jgi:hypothetical protein